MNSIVTMCGLSIPWCRAAQQTARRAVALMTYSKDFIMNRYSANEKALMEQNELLLPTQHLHFNSAHNDIVKHTVVDTVTVSAISLLPTSGLAYCNSAQYLALSQNANLRALLPLCFFASRLHPVYK